MTDPYLSFSRRRFRIAWAFAFLALLGGSFAAWQCLFPASPEGVYYDPFIGSSEPTYWVLREGQVWLKEKGASNITAGVFLRSNGVWVLRGEPNTPDVILRPTPFGLRMISKPGSGMSKYLPKRGYSWLRSGECYDLNVPAVH